MKTVTGQARWEYFAELRQGALEGCICSEMAPIIQYYFSHIARIHRYSNQEVEMEVAPFTDP